MSYKVILEINDAPGKNVTGDEFMKISVEGKNHIEPGTVEYASLVSTDLFLAAGIHLAGAVNSEEQFFTLALGTFKKGTIFGGLKRLAERGLFNPDPDEKASMDSLLTEPN